MGMHYTAVAAPLEKIRDVLLNGDTESLYEFLDDGLDLTKLWKAAQMLITEDATAMEPALTGVPATGDLGLGPALLAVPSEVARVAATLDGLTREILADRYDPELLTKEQIYPEIWDGDDPALADEVIDAAVELVAYYRDAAKQGLAILALVG